MKAVVFGAGFERLVETRFVLGASPVSKTKEQGKDFFFSFGTQKLELVTLHELKVLQASGGEQCFAVELGGQRSCPGSRYVIGTAGGAVFSVRQQ